MYISEREFNNFLQRIEDLIETKFNQLQNQSNDYLEYMTINEASVFLDVDRTTLYKWMNKGAIKFYLKGGKRYFDRNYLENLKYFFDTQMRYDYKINLRVVREFTFKQMYKS